jgi:hypothetical protein
MFGLDAWLAKKHLVSHLIVAFGKWVSEPGNPLLAHVPAAIQPELLAEIASEVAARQKMIDAEAPKAK